MTTVRTELGISPVLFQAIAQVTGCASSTSTQDSVVNLTEKTATLAKQATNFTTPKEMEGAHSAKDATSHMVSQLLQNLNEPVVSLLPPTRPTSQLLVSSLNQSTSNTDSNQSVFTQAGLSMLGITSDRDPNHVSSGPSSQSQQQISIGQQQQQQSTNPMLVTREELNNFLLKQEPAEDDLPSSGSSVAPVQTMNTDLSSVLSALASQHAQQSMLQRNEDSQSQQRQLKNASIGNTGSTTSDLISNIVNTSETQRNQQPQIIIYGLQYNNNNNNNVASHVSVSATSSSHQNESDNVLLEEGDGVNNGPTTYRVLLQSPGGSSMETKTVMLPTDNNYDMQHISSGVQPISDVQNAAEGMNQPCPVCGDKVSGYHYGIFTCESCKGFFKRTVQNKKTFVCPKSADCIVNSVNRKKCPACRFRLCLQMGMKLEAIRQDRTRGGRSSYDGCASHKARPVMLKKTTKRLNRALEDFSPGPSQELDDGSKSHRNLVAILNHNAHKQTSQSSGSPPIPELLRDIMNLEPLLNDEDIPPDSMMDSSGFPDQALYSYMMQLAELRLYKLVRWARNLPQFGAISTDDQILLLQNCWSELIALALCWRSIDTPNQISISSTHHITTEWAQHLGCEDLVARLLSITNAFRNLYMDNYEYVALKVLLLISPDVKGLKDPRKIRDFQDKLMEALMIYTMQHYPNVKNKFGELLLRLPELSRLSFLSKNILLKYLPTSSTTCGLLVELLKGDSRAEQDNTSGAGVSGLVL